MNGHGLTPRDLREQNRDAIEKSGTFETHGLSKLEAKRYLLTSEGKLYLQRMVESAPPGTEPSIIKRYAIEHITSGRDLPRMEVINEPLVKIVPAGESVTAYSPYFTQRSELENALAKGQNLSERFALPIKSEAAVYDVYEVRPRRPTEVFVSQVASTSELGGQITKAGGATQYLIPNRSLFTEAARVASIGNDLAVHREFVVKRGLGAPIAATGEAIMAEAAAARGLRPGALARGAGAAVAAAAVTYDVTAATRDATHLYEQGNATGAESKIIGAVSRNVGGLGGVALGAAAGAAVTSETGPGAIIGGVVGGVVGAVAGDKVAHWIDQYRINHQSDRAGNEWSFDPERPEQGWTRRELDLDAMRYTRGAPVYKPEPLKAGPELADALNFKASNRAIELALSAPPRSQSPYEIPPSTQDRTAPGVHGGDWMRNPETGAWGRTNSEYVDGRVRLDRPEIASPERAAELDRQSEAILARNAASTPAALAANYQAAYAQYGWSRHGPMPEAVTDALRHPGRVVGSDGDLYERNARGQWTHDGLLWDSQADGNLRRELETTYQAQQRAGGGPVTTLEPVIVRPEPEPKRGQAAAPHTATGARRPDDPDHPDHALLEKIRSGVRDLDRQTGKPWDEHSERLSASLLALAAEKKFTADDDIRVAFNRPTSERGTGQIVHLARVGHPGPDPAAHRAHMDTGQALAATVDDSYRRLEAVRQSQAATAQLEQQTMLRNLGDPAQPGGPRMSA